MNSSPDRVRLHAAPTGVNVGGGALAALLAGSASAVEAARVETRRAVLAEVEEFVAGCRREVEALRESMLDSAVEIAAVLAEAVVKRQLDTDLDLTGVVRMCLASTSADVGACSVRVHPNALPALERSGLGARVALRGDPELAPGEVRLETPVGMLVHDPFAALTQARDALLAELGSTK